jgi:hypothetical protein
MRIVGIVRIALVTGIAALGVASPRAASAQSLKGGYFGLTTGYGWGTSTQT